jgi:hypothetical protein
MCINILFVSSVKVSEACRFEKENTRFHCSVSCPSECSTHHAQNTGCVWSIICSLPWRFLYLLFPPPLFLRSCVAIPIIVDLSPEFIRFNVDKWTSRGKILRRCKRGNFEKEKCRLYGNVICREHVMKCGITFNFLCYVVCALGTLLYEVKQM